MFTFGRVFSDTDKLAEGRDEVDITFMFYKYNKDGSGNGEDELVFSEVTNLGLLKNAAGCLNDLILDQSGHGLKLSKNVI